MTETYSPFSKSISELTVSDLARLRDVREGWYVDYKRAGISTKDIGKAISAFANTYGGWLFFGVEERSKEEPFAGKFVGIKKADAHRLLQTIRQSAHDHVFPTPHFETSILEGPDEQIGLGEDAAILIVFIPMSSNTPHVHSDGRIYRRVADASEPKPETDRSLLDSLWRRREENLHKLRKWIEAEPEFSEQEKNHPFVRLLFTTDPCENRKSNSTPNLSIQQFRKVLGSHNHHSAASVPFDAIHTNAEGVVARQVNNNDPNRLTLTWLFLSTLAGEILIPLQTHEVSETIYIHAKLSGYDHATAFISSLEKFGFSKVKLVDLNVLFFVFIAMCHHYLVLLKEAGKPLKYEAKIQMLNCWRVVPFLDADYVMKSFDTNAVPVCLASNSTLPRGTDPDSFIEMTVEENDDLEQAAISHAYVLLLYVSRGFGLPIDIPDDDSSIIPNILELVGAARRGVSRQNNAQESA